MQSTRYLPDTDRLSIISATILLAFSLSRFVHIPEQQLRLSFAGILILINLNTQLFTLPIVAGLAASGSDWLIRSHPHWKKKHSFQHWLLPLLTAFVLGFPITILPLSASWWISYILGAAILMGVLLAEYIIVDPNDARRALASTALVAVSYVIYFIFTVAFQLLGYRLLVTLPAIMLATFFVSFRSFTLRLPGHFPLIESAVISLIITQFAAAFHYWPISPVSYGLVLLGLSYSLFLFFMKFTSPLPIKKALPEPLAILLLAWLVAYWLK